MSGDDAEEAQLRGPIAYENWRAALSGVPWRAAFEYPLFSDAHVVGGIALEYGPYRLINALHDPRIGSSRPTLVLYVEWHLGSELPQMSKTDDERYHGGHLQDEITALVSLCLGIQLKAGGESREFAPTGDPRGFPRSWAFSQDPILPTRSKTPILPRVVGGHHLDDTAILAEFPALSPQDAIALIRAARLYQEAVWIAETTPELSWLMLTSAVETAANRWRDTIDSPLERLRVFKPDLENLLKTKGDEEFVAQVAEQIAPYLGAAKKFRDFIREFLPDPPAKRPEKAFQHPWTRKKVTESVNKIYEYRSIALHGGKPFPAPMCAPPHWVSESGVPEEVPLGMAASMLGGVWLADDTPMLLHTFEYIVQQTLIKWWRSMLPSPTTLTDIATNGEQRREQ